MSQELRYAAKWAERSLKGSRKYSKQIPGIVDGTPEDSRIHFNTLGWLRQCYVLLHCIMSGYRQAGPQYKHVEWVLSLKNGSITLDDRTWMRSFALQRLDALRSAAPTKTFPGHHPSIRVRTEIAVYELVVSVVNAIEYECGSLTLTYSSINAMSRAILRLVRTCITACPYDYRYDRVGPKTIALLRKIKSIFS